MVRKEHQLDAFLFGFGEAVLQELAKEGKSRRELGVYDELKHKRENAGMDVLHVLADQRKYLHCPAFHAIQIHLKRFTVLILKL